MKRPHGNGSGFTLIELLVVVSLMVLVTTIVVSSAFGLTRGASFSAAENTTYKFLEYARQRACMDGKKVVACFFQSGDSDAPTYSVAIFERAGVVTDKPASGYITDRYNLIEDDVRGRAIWNFDAGRLTKISESAEAWKLRSRSNGPAEAPIFENSKVKYAYECTQMKLDNASGWSQGDAYGFEIADRQDFPKGFKVEISGADKAKSGNCEYVCFDPDGSASKQVSITLTESVSGKKVVISVNTDGTTSVETEKKK